MAGPFTLTEPVREVLQEIGSSDKRLYASELGRLLGKSQAAVFKNLEYLLSAKLLTSQQEYRGGPQFMMMTQKGAMYAITECHITLRQILANHPYIYKNKWGKQDDDTIAEIKNMLDEMKSYGIEQIYVDAYASLIIKNDLFDTEGNIILDTKTLRYRPYWKVLFVDIAYRIKEAKPGLIKMNKLELAQAWEQYCKASRLFSDSEAKQVKEVILLAA